MSNKNFMSYGDAETVFTEFTDNIKKKEPLGFKGTQAEWDALSENEQAIYKVRDIIDNSGGDIALYVNNQLELSDLERISLTNNTDYACSYDGIVYISYSGNAHTPGIYYLNGTQIGKYEGSYNSAQNSFSITVKKGDIIKASLNSGSPVGYATWYKKRDYSQRT